MPRARVFGRVNPLVPSAAVLVGLLAYVAGHRPVGVGFAIGALLALMNGLFLSRRVEVAADVGDLGRALLVMQLGLLLTVTLIGIVTIVLVKISLAMAVACAAGFGATHLGILVVFYLTRARGSVALEGKAT
jgi:hypothetical protein